jgi:hypothetical protein
MYNKLSLKRKQWDDKNQSFNIIVFRILEQKTNEYKIHNEKFSLYAHSCKTRFYI